MRAADGARHEIPTADRANLGTLHALVEQQALSAPNRTATVYNGVRTCYADLNDHANRLGAFLRQRCGVRTGDRVALLAAKSDALIAALIGVMKAGAAYVPINPRLPREAVARVFAELGAAVLVVDSRHAQAAITFEGPVFVLDVELADLPPAPNPDVRVDGRDLAYVIHTSGSTGRPKPIGIEHLAIVNTIDWRIPFYGLDCEDVNLQVPSVAFDSSVVDIFSFLAVGASLVIPDDEHRLAPTYLRELIEAHGVTRLIATASYYEQLRPQLAGVRTLRSLTVAGESTSPDLVMRHFRTLPGVRLVNEYGPSENAVCSTACDLTDGTPTVPIGRPIANVQVLVLDARGQPAGVGVSGEIHLAGTGLSRGYLDQPALTADRFRPCPFAGHGARMYRTGDCGYWRADGALEFVGRHDRQIKLRGFRIELGDIESVLREHAAVGEVAVVAKSTPDPHLAAYVVAADRVEVAALHELAATRLPDYMVPTVIRILPALPLTWNGKLDRRVLQEWDDDEPRAEEMAVRADEAAMLQVCREVMAHPGLRPTDDLFSAGATSLKVMELVARLRDIAIRVDLPDLYAHPTVRALASMCRS